MRYLRAPDGWEPEQPNPFAEDGTYGASWSCFSYLGPDDESLVTGRSKSGCWLFRAGRRNPGIHNRLADFIRYENAWGRTVIVQVSCDTDCEQLVKRALSETPDPNALRGEDPEILVHSTTMESWEQIQASGELKAASLTAARNSAFGATAPNDVERYLQQEPAEYKEFVMFGSVGGSGPESIQASYKAGRFLYDEDAPYEPGVRIYLHNHRIIADGLAARDGLHQTKVHLRLPLAGYMLKAVRAVDLVIPDGFSHWTPKLFTESADRFFLADIR